MSWQKTAMPPCQDVTLGTMGGVGFISSQLITGQVSVLVPDAELNPLSQRCRQRGREQRCPLVGPVPAMTSPMGLPPTARDGGVC